MREVDPLGLIFVNFDIPALTPGLEAALEFSLSKEVAAFILGLASTFCGCRRTFPVICKYKR
jgi:hypothetical protein